MISMKGLNNKHIFNKEDEPLVKGDEVRSSGDDDGCDTLEVEGVR